MLVPIRLDSAHTSYYPTETPDNFPSVHSSPSALLSHHPRVLQSLQTRLGVAGCPSLSAAVAVSNPLRPFPSPPANQPASILD
ncbi:hypothetical protein V8C35DRAFT_290697 [Trichoderma chlorosporum]